MSLCFREANFCVDALAKLGASISDGNTCLVTPPPEVIPLCNLISWECMIIGYVLLFVETTLANL